MLIWGHIIQIISLKNNKQIIRNDPGLRLGQQLVPLYIKQPNNKLNTNENKRTKIICIQERRLELSPELSSNREKSQSLELYIKEIKSHHHEAYRTRVYKVTKRTATPIRP